MWPVILRLLQGRDLFSIFRPVYFDLFGDSVTTYPYCLPIVITLTRVESFTMLVTSPPQLV